MNNIFITLDYEIFFGKSNGTQYNSMVYPTQKILELLDKYGIKASFFIDSGYLVQLYNYQKKYPILKADYQTIISQIKQIDSNGHDIQLHIHPHWEDSYFDGKKWIIDTTRYKLSDFSNQEIDKIVYSYKKALTDIVGEKVFAYRAGGWCIQPFDKIKNILKKHNIWLDSTLFKGGKNNSSTHYFNFENIPDRTMWSFEEDPCQEQKNGFFIEVPISSHKVSPLFFLKLIYYKKFGGSEHKKFGDGTSAGGSNWDKLRMLTRYTRSVVSIDGYKASFLEEAYRDFLKEKRGEHFVVIGHPKSISFYSLKRLEKFIRKYSNKNFTTYKREFYDEDSNDRTR